MKITMYELLGLVKDGKAPKKIKIDNIIYELDEENNKYYTKMENCRFALGSLEDETNLIFYAFENKIEIIEEEKKIPEKLDHLIGYDIQQFDDLKEYVEITTNDLFGKVNKVIDTLNQLSDYLKSKGDE